ncbi:MAG: cytochrome P450 [Solirubrobacteraceae bacterium]
MAVQAPDVPNPVAPDHVVNPWPGLTALRDTYPIVWHELTQSWLVSRYEHVRPILRDVKRFGTPHMAQLLNLYLGDAPTFTEMEGSEHTHRRGLVAPFFAANGVARFTEVIERQARAGLEPLFERERQAIAGGLRARGEIDFVTEFSSQYPVDVVGDMMALPDRDYGKLQRIYNAFINAVGNIAGDPVIHETGLRAKDEFRDYILPLIAERRSGEGDDLISLLCSSELDGRSMTDEEIRSFLALIVLAGGETTDHQLGFLIAALAQFPEQQQALREDRSLMERALAEGMRYCGTVQFIQRTALEDVELEGFSFAEGTRLTLLLAAANRDPRRFKEPDKFDIFREDLDMGKAFSGAAEHTGFGGGRHICLGSHLARSEMEIALGLLLDNTSSFRLVDGFVPSPKPDAVFVRALPSVKLSFDPV